MPIAIVYVCWYYLRPVGGASCFLFYFILLFFDDVTPLLTTVRALCDVIVLSFATIYRGRISLSDAYGCGEIVGWSGCYDISIHPSSSHHMARYPRAFPCGRPATRASIVYLFWFLFTLLLTISIFTLPLLLTYSRLLQFLHTRIPTLLDTTLESIICLIKNKSLNFPESRRNKKVLEPTRRLMMVSSVRLESDVSYHVYLCIKILTTFAYLFHPQRKK